MYCQPNNIKSTGNPVNLRSGSNKDNLMIYFNNLLIFIHTLLYWSSTTACDPAMSLYLIN